MTPDRARVFYVDDDVLSFEVCKVLLEEDGHRVVEKAVSLREALEKIPKLGKKGVNVAVVNGNLGRGDESGRDGEIIARMIKACHPEIKVVGHSLFDPVSGADVNSPKMAGAGRLVETVKKA